MNPELLKDYNNEKANLLYINHGNDKEQSKNIKEIINDFKEIYQYDLKNADMPEPIGIFDNESEKKKQKEKYLFEFDFYMIIGNIFVGYIEELIRNVISPYAIDMPITIINYEELYNLGIMDLFNIISRELNLENYKNTRYEPLFFQEYKYVEEFDEYGNPIKIKDLPDKNIMPIYSSHAYFSSYVFPTLIEYFLGIHLRSELLYSSMDKMKKLKKNKAIVLSQREEWLFSTFSKRGTKTLTGNEITTMKELYDMFVKYNIFEENIDYEMILVGEVKKNKKKISRTIGGIINSPYANEVIVPEYMDLIKWLFSPEYLNIRNNIMHGNNINLDYFGICFPCIMLHLIWSIAKKELFIKRV